MIKKLIICSLFLTLLFGWHFIRGEKARPETHCGFPTEEEHRLVKEAIAYHGIELQEECGETATGYWFWRGGEKIKLLGYLKEE